jgi:hypothetical protein
MVTDMPFDVIASEAWRQPLGRPKGAKLRWDLLFLSEERTKVARGEEVVATSQSLLDDIEGTHRELTYQLTYG